MFLSSKVLSKSVRPLRTPERGIQSRHRWKQPFTILRWAGLVSSVLRHRILARMSTGTRDGQVSLDISRQRSYLKP